MHQRHADRRGRGAVLTIKRAQRALAGEEAFVERVIRHLLIFHRATVEPLPEGELRRRVVHGIERGRSHGLTWEYSLTIFVANMLERCPDFDEHPAIRRVLEDESLQPDERMDALLERVPKEAWDEVVAQCDEDAYWQALDADDEPAPDSEDD